MYIQPDFLKKGDQVAIVATAKNFDKKEISSAIQQLKAWGLVVLLGENVYKKFHQYAGTDEERLSDLQWALDTKEIKAVFCARGGYGTARIVDAIEWDNFSENPKWVIGFSDVTALHAEIQKIQVKSIHGIMPVLFGLKGYEASVKNLQVLLFGKKINYKLNAHALNKQGEAEGIVEGGNLSILCSLIGTASEFDPDNKILFIEDVGENLYRIDRMIVQLKRTGVFASLSGLIVGHFTGMLDNPVKFGKTAYEIIAEAVEEYDFPVCYGFPAGHQADNFPLVLGTEITLSVQPKFSTII